MKERITPAQSDDLSDYESEPELTRLQKAGAWLRTWKGIVTIAAVLLMMAVLWSGETLYRGIKEWRAGRLLARAEEADRSGNDAEEFRLLREAFMLLPDQPLTLRAVARYHERRNEATALQLYERLLDTHKATAEDKVRACTLALTYGKMDLGRKLLEGLRSAEETRQKPAVLALEAQLLAMEGAWEPAVAKARTAASQPGDNARAKLLLATLLLRAAERSQAGSRATMGAEAIDILASFVTRPDEFGVEALSTLVAVARLPQAYALLAGRNVAAWVDAAARHPMAGARLRVLTWDLLLAARAEEPEKVFKSFLAKWREADLPGQLEAARWLNQRSQPTLSLEISTPRHDLSSDWFFVYLDALAATHRWIEVLAQLQTDSGQAAAMTGALRALFVLRARVELKQRVDIPEAWRDIQILTQNETIHNRLYIASYAEKMGQAVQAAAIYRRLLDQPPGELIFGHALSKEEKMTCYSGLIRMTPETAPASELLPLLDALCREFPEMDDARNDAIYLRLLTGKVTAEMQSDLARLLRLYPAVLAYRTTAVLFELRSHEPARAAKLYQGWQIDWDTAADRFRAVRVAALKATGRWEEADPLRAIIDRHRLRPEEIALLDSPEI